MPLGLFPRETADILSGGLDTGTTPPNVPPWYTGAGLGTALGIGKGAVEAAQASGAGSADLLSALSPTPDFTTPREPERTDDDTYRAQAMNAQQHLVAAFTPDPHVVGYAGQQLSGFSGALTQFGLGTFATGGNPLGGAVVVGGAQGYETRQELQTQGVDRNTAMALGAGSALFSGAGALLPGGFGLSLLERLTTGAYAQAGVGILNRSLMHNVLDDAGYPDMARAYQPLDGAALLADTVLGMGFGVMHHAFAPRPSQIDAAHAVLDGQHIEDAAGGPAVDPQSRTAIVDNQVAAADRLASGADTPAPSADVRVVPDAAQESDRQARARGVDDAAAEAGAGRVEAPVEPQEPTAIIAEAQARAQAEPPKPPDAEAAPVLDPATAEAVGQAQEVLARLGDLKIENDAGERVGAADALRRSLDDIHAAQGDSELHRVAAACFGRG